ncbi:MAG: hypothetical protein SX243_01700 [Acidobacteriota bacterium]|nr:hypothetical protein [Acidobacteriota bacterium]
MTAETTLTGLVLAALSLGALHSLAPDHWVPFAAVGRARRWSTGRTLRVTLLCGLGHLAATALLALGGFWLGAETLAAFGTGLTTAAGLLLIAGGLTYAAWRWRTVASRRLQEAAEDDPSALTTGGLLVIFALDPCVALIPLVFAAATLGPTAVATVALTYAAATLTTMTALVAPAHRGLQTWRTPFLSRWADVLAGGTVALVGLGVMVLGI